MIVYSETIASFIARIKKYAFDIMRDEMKLTMEGEKVIRNGYVYEVQFVVFENKRLLGFCQSRLLQVGINRNLMYTEGNKRIKNVLRHELAHLVAAWEYGYDILDHGPEFRIVCKRYGWGKEVQAAEDDFSFLDEGEKRETLPDEKVIQKVKKLMSLAKSGNLHEAELATVKANQLLLRHNLEEIDAKNFHDESTTYVENILKSRQLNGKIRAIISILETFYVYPICNYGVDVMYVQVIGNKTSVVLAEYVAKFLDRELERLWHLNRKKLKLSGGRDKKWFMFGVAKGYQEKIERQTLVKENKKALVFLKEDLARRVLQVFPRLYSQSSSSGRPDDQSVKAGYEEGSNLSIHQGVSSKNHGLLID